MKSNIFVPTKIRVGYQTRQDTYTKQLAYVIYYDQKNKLRKEVSWQSWRDEKIEPNDFDNVPTEGFVLNKKVGDCCCDWNHRQAYVRVYDPRNFEFEITVENLLYILENTSAIKGKGLEGEFVYGWDGKDLLLIPTASPDYQSMSDYSNIVFTNSFVKAKDLVVGATYLAKDNIEYIYIGRFDCYSNGYLINGQFFSKYSQMEKYCNQNNINSNDYEYENGNIGKHFVFAQRLKASDYGYDKCKYRFSHSNSISQKYIACANSECTSDYAEIFDALEHNELYSPIDNTKDEFVAYDTLEDFNQLFSHSYSIPDVLSSILSDGERQLYEVCSADNGTYRPHCKKKYKKNNRYWNSRWYDENSVFETKKSSTFFRGYNYDVVPITLQEIFDKLQPVYKNVYLANGKFHHKEY